MNERSRRVKIIEKDEPLTIIKLEDGTIVNIRLVVFGAHIILNADGSLKLNDDGSPMYGINFQQCLFIDTFERIPDGVKKN